ncbi:IclR family transcriptional regulator [Paraburkholderia unamae]|uniref:IclR family transcriptional regulator n=1 Tax=Paraburkholderia unamae TaxID=219649 RepID=A0ABX5KJ48_9BURK|nr:helix-turn-helix domain-containing protein [Paraburkholderia unamae]PVX81646.1 IclR family transcriptional regulator [Paraburkholderia unamae]RAR62641.1 IclR family transcriptional regulator [Paraburkholderia unamae]
MREVANPHTTGVASAVTESRGSPSNEAQQVRAPQERPGTRSLSRSIKVMRMVASRPGIGWRLSDLAHACEEDRATVHRVLTRLVDERLVRQRHDDRHYLPGPLLFELGLALPEHAQFQRSAETILRVFAHEMNCVAMLLLRSGDDFVCAVREGSALHTGTMMHPGTRRPLITSAGGLAILLTLPEREASRIVAENTEQEIKRHGHGRLNGLKRMRERSAQYGMGLNLGDLVPHSFAYALPVRNRAGETFAAFVITGKPEQFPESSVDELRLKLRRVADALEIESAVLET